MATKVFYRCIKSDLSGRFTIGREYECVTNSFVVDNEGYSVTTGDYGLVFYFGCQLERIERETFTAHGFQWFKHVPGEPRPCDINAQIYTLLSSDRLGSGGESYSAQYASWHCKNHKNSDIIGWRYADSEQKEPVKPADPFPASVWDSGSEDESERNDLIAAVDDGHLTPDQKAYINAKEEKVAERLRSEAAKEELKRADHSKSIQDLANANGAVKFEHDHRLGWMQ